MEVGTKQIRFQAQMSCSGCSNSITRILNKCDGVKHVECSIPEQSVVVLADERVDPGFLLEKINVWAQAAGKQVSLVS